MITMQEIIKDTKWDDIPLEHQESLNKLLEIINVIRKEYNRPMIVSSGYRSKEDQLRIYNEKGVMDESKIPWGSSHLKGMALDIYDPKQELQKWCLENPTILEENLLYMEDFAYTKNWVHFQINPFRSYKEGGTRYFKP